MKQFSTLIFGGSFDPIHNGHVYIATEACKKLDLQGLIFIPTSQNPLKHQPYAGSNDRLRMVELAIEPYADFEISTIEIASQGDVFTIDTVRSLQEQNILDVNAGMLMGDELAESFEQWKDYKELCKRISIVIACRNTRSISMPCRYTPIDNAVLDISSHDIRRRIAHGLSYREFLPKKVYDYIQERALYTDGT